ncbi:hypothetical protein KCP74_03070 [Salmonella enterica subsp. enterica]|nr:hypothetical protein KCP74_03070 [Salmonella enterica subsp. enterica]
MAQSGWTLYGKENTTRTPFSSALYFLFLHITSCFTLSKRSKAVTVEAKMKCSRLNTRPISVMKRRQNSLPVKMRWQASSRRSVAGGLCPFSRDCQQTTRTRVCGN